MAAAGPHARKRPKATTRAHISAVNNGICQHFSPRSKARIADDASRTNAHSITQLYLASQKYIGVNKTIFADPDLATNINPAWVGKARAIQHQSLHKVFLHMALKLRQLDSIVDASYFCFR